jgi:hypothetical protein
MMIEGNGSGYSTIDPWPLGVEPIILTKSSSNEASSLIIGILALSDSKAGVLGSNIY